MRVVIKEICKELEISVLYVTHDQVEALAMSDRILVMRAGKVLQEGTPAEIYHRPENQFVASFIGAANLLEGMVRTLRGSIRGCRSPAWDDRVCALQGPFIRRQGPAIDQT